MKKSYLLYGGIFLGIVFLVGGIFLSFRKQIPPFWEKELSSQISPPITEVVPTSSPSAEESSSAEVLPLFLSSPQDKTIVSTSSLKVSGKTKPLAEVFVNEEELKADKEGNFSTILTLDEGENVIEVIASDSEGNYAEKEMTVVFEPEEES